MAETSKELPLVFVVRLRGGIGDGRFRIALGRVPPGLVIDRDGAEQAYEYAGPEEQWDRRYLWDKAANRNVRVSQLAAVYHIYRPAPEVKA